MMCQTCVRLGRERSPSRCQYCQHCSEHEHCPCRRCASKLCKVVGPPSRVCSRCSYCVKHHAGPVYKPEVFPHRSCNGTSFFQASFRQNSLRRSLGCEFELSDIGLLTSSSLRDFGVWARDASVRPSGLEFDTKPYIGDSYLRSIPTLVREFAHANCMVNETCGFHVHVDCPDASLWDLRRILCAWTLLEPSVYGVLVDAARWDHVDPNGVNFAVPYSTWLSPEPIKKLMALGSKAATRAKARLELENFFNQHLYGLSEKARMPSMRDWEWRQYRQSLTQALREKKSHKYENAVRRRSLNLHSWMMRGTLEFRCKEGTLDMEDCLYWPLWCGWFVNNVLAAPDSLVFDWMKSQPSVLEVTQSWYKPNKGLPRPHPSLLYWVEARTAKGTPIGNRPPTAPRALSPGPRELGIDAERPWPQYVPDPRPPRPTFSAPALGASYSVGYLEESDPTPAVAPAAAPAVSNQTAQDATETYEQMLNRVRFQLQQRRP